MWLGVGFWDRVSGYIGPGNLTLYSAASRGQLVGCRGVTYCVPRGSPRQQRRKRVPPTCLGLGVRLGLGLGL